MIAQGARGVISVAANVLPAEMSLMVKNALEGNYDEARALSNDLFDLMDVMFIEASPAPAKRALNLMGKNVGGLRMPLKEMSEENDVVLQEVMKKYDLI
jgi:4-hydroxy-tetrahydrodipicolinate synthase